MQNTIERPITARQLVALIVSSSAILVGIISDILFFNNKLGINVALSAAVFILVGVTLLWYFKQPFLTVNTMFALFALAFALLAAVLSALTFLNILIIIGMLFLFVRFGSEQKWMGGNWWLLIEAGIQGMLANWFEGPLVIISESLAGAWRMRTGLRLSPTTAALLRGLLITIPVLVVFSLLLGSADIVFGDLLSDAVSWIDIDAPEDWFLHLLLIGIFTWLAMVGYKLLLLGPISYQLNQPTPKDESQGEVEEGKSSGKLLQLGIIESGMLLGGINLLFLAFCIIQATYLFGGETNITQRGYTYAEYARRGFFEILAVSFITLLIVVLLNTLTERSTARQTNLFFGLVTGLVLLTLVLLAASFHRLNLYEEAFGYTRLRVMTQVFIIWLGLLFGVLLVSLWLRRNGLFWLAAFVVCLGYAFTLNLINIDSFIASRNIARWENGEELDLDYLFGLSHDAVPALTDLLDADMDEAQRTQLLTGLGWKLWELDQDREERGLLDYHFGKVRAYNAVDAHRDALESYKEPPPSRLYLGF